MTTLCGKTLRACLAASALLTIAASRPVLADDETAWIDDLGLGRGLPLLMLPRAAGAVVGIDEHRKIDSYTQVITLDGDAGTAGENAITVTVTRDGLAPRVAEETIAAEMDKRLPPGMTMSQGAPGTADALGIFGSASGDRGPLTCLYAWQSVNLADRWITGRDAGLLDEQHGLSIRVRLCRMGVSPAALTALMQGLASGARGAVTRPVAGRLYHDALSAASDLGGAHGAPVDPPMAATAADPMAFERPASPFAATRVRGRRELRKTAHRVRRAAPEDSRPPPTPMAGMPDVPLPQ